MCGCLGLHFSVVKCKYLISFPLSYFFISFPTVNQIIKWSFLTNCLEAFKQFIVTVETLHWHSLKNANLSGNMKRRIACICANFSLIKYFNDNLWSKKHRRNFIIQSKKGFTFLGFASDQSSFSSCNNFISLWKMHCLLSVHSELCFSTFLH